MISFSLSDLAALAGIVFAFLALLVSFMVLYTQRRKTRYDDDRHRVELELMRRSIETQMYGLSEKLVATESRWRDVNHLLLSSQSKQRELQDTSKKSVPTDFLRSAGLTPDDLEVQENLVFVLTPFHPQYKKQFQIISNVCQNLGLVVMRGDEEYVSEDVFSHILKLIAKARLIIANIDGRNPNVFYELGIAHAMGKATVLIAPTPEDVPFDIRTKRLVLFASLDELEVKLRDELARAFIKRSDA